MKHSIQPVSDDGKGVLRFATNSIVAHLLDAGPYDLNELATKGFPNEDWEHFAQLIGHSLDGWGSLSYVSDEAFARAAAQSKGGSEVEALEALVASLQGRIKAASQALGWEDDE